MRTATYLALILVGYSLAMLVFYYLTGGDVATIAL